MNQVMGQWLMIAGLLTLALGALLYFTGRLPFSGGLPGDLRFKWGSTVVYIPVMTSLLLSVLFSLLAWLLGRFTR